MHPAPTSQATRRWTPPGPLDLARTLAPLGRGPGDPAFRITPDGSVWRASRTPQGPGTIRVRSSAGEVTAGSEATAGSEVTADGFGPGGQWLLDRLPDLLGGDDDPSGFRPRHRLVHEAHRRNPGLRLTRTGLVLESLIPAVLEQKVTADEAYRAWRLLLHRHGEAAPGPLEGLRVMPDARTWALIPSWEWHRAGVDNKRASTIVRAARAGARMEEAAGMSPADAAARLRVIPGIGPWTAAETVQRSHGAPDAITVGDLHLPNLVGYALTGERRTDDAGMLELLAPYEGQRHRAARLILLVAPRVPRRAPRFSPNDIRLI